MNLNKTILVNQGQAMITEAINTSQPIILTKFTIGKGTVATENAALALTNVVLSHRDVAIANNTQEGNVYKCTCYYDNKTEPADVTIKEIGLYGKVGASGTVKLFAYVTFEPGDYLPIGGGSVYSEYSKVLNVGITELATVDTIVNIIVDKATKTSLGVVQVGNGVAVNTNGVISLATANDGIIVNVNDIKLDTINTLVSTSITKPLSANMGKQLQDTKANETTQIIAGSGLTGGGDLSANRTLNVVSANNGIVVNADNIELKPATTSVIGGVKPTVSHGGSTYNVSTGELYIPLSRKVFSTLGQIGLSGTVTIQEVVDAVVANAPCDFYIETSAVITTGLPSAYSSLHIISGAQTNNNMVTISAYCSGKHYVNKTIGTPPYTLVGWEQVITQEGGTLTGALNGTTATFSGNVTAPNLAYDTTQIIAGLGLTGGGDISTDRTINIVSANAGIVVNADNIELKPATTSVIGGVKPDGTTTSVDLNGVISTVNRASTSTQIIAGAGLTGGGTLAADRTLNIVSANAGIVVNADNIELKPATTSIIGGVKIGADMTVSADGTINPLLNQTTADGRYVKKAGDIITGPLTISTTTDGIILNGTSGDHGIVLCNTNTTTYPYTRMFKSEGSSGFYLRTMTAAAEYKDIIVHSYTDGKVSYAGGAFSGDITAPGIFTTNGTNGTGIFARYNNLETDQVYLYSNSTSTGIYNNMPTHGDVFIFSRSKSTGVVSYAGGNYGTINGSTATFSGNVTAPSITIGGYVVTIV